jgi:DNA (cytosine-5)-methyltransferase 1
MRSVELFTGAGGLAMGISAAGFHHDAMIERDQDACDTIRENKRRGVRPVTAWPKVFQGDVHAFDYGSVRGGVDLVAGGPPCQPFSLGGKHRGHNDHRDMWPEAVRAVRELRPRAFIFENVRGLVRQSFATYFEHILLQLTYPDLAPKEDEKWSDHRARLERHHTTSRGQDRLRYNVVFQVLNASDYGVPQRRLRVFIVGFRSDLSIEWSFPPPTHSAEALLWSQWVTREYWDRHRVPNKARPARPRESGQLQMPTGKPATAPWLTVRDAIHDLPEPRPGLESGRFLNHRFNPGARSYAGHTGSPLDEPAKTLKAGDHGVPGGENMLAYVDGRVRYFTVRESARLQAFPDDYVFRGSWTECMRQIGNAVPVTLSQAVARSVAVRLRARSQR